MRRRWRFVGPLAVAATLLLMIAPLLVGDLVPEDRPANSSPACALTVVYIGLGVLALGVTALFIGARRRPMRRGRSQHAQAEAVPVLVPPAGRDGVEPPHPIQTGRTLSAGMQASSRYEERYAGSTCTGGACPKRSRV